MSNITTLGRLQGRWDALATRERRLLTGAAVLVTVALVWWVALSPALNRLKAAAAQGPQLEAQLQKMHSLKAQAMALQSQPKLSGTDAQAALESLVKQRLAGTGQLVVAGDRATLTLKGAGADALAQWLSQARVNARAVPSEVRLVKSEAKGDKGAAATAWDGTVILSLPAR